MGVPPIVLWLLTPITLTKKDWVERPPELAVDTNILSTITSAIEDVMLSRIRLTNFKKFVDYSVKLEKSNILVGPNNSGKSSILDSLRVLHACFRHTRATSPVAIDVPSEGVFRGFEVPRSIIPVPIANIAHEYSDDDAVMEFVHSNGSAIKLRLHPERGARLYLVAGSMRQNTSIAFRRAFPLELVIVPTLAPFEEQEHLQQPETVRKNESTRLASRSFRNIWRSKTVEEFAEFKTLVEEHWPEITISPPEVTRGLTATIDMFYSEGRKDREYTGQASDFKCGCKS